MNSADGTPFGFDDVKDKCDQGRSSYLLPRIQGSSLPMLILGPRRAQVTLNPAFRVPYDEEGHLCRARWCPIFAAEGGDGKQRRTG